MPRARGAAKEAGPGGGDRIERARSEESAEASSTRVCRAEQTIESRLRSRD
jgi:hypothetical protein